MTTTDSPALMLVIPARATAAAGDPELSSIFQPVMSTANAVPFVTSNQSAATGLFPLDHGATSEMNTRPVVPGEPISTALFVAANAPCTFTALNVAMLTLRAAL